MCCYTELYWRYFLNPHSRINAVNANWLGINKLCTGKNFNSRQSDLTNCFCYFQIILFDSQEDDPELQHYCHRVRYFTSSLSTTNHTNFLE